MNETGRPNVSVVIPTYNRAALLGRAIRSVIEQTYEDFELIVIDDASTDGTDEVIALFNDPRIRHVRHEENRGGGAARNTGINLAQGEYVAFLDSDDEWMKAKLDKQLSVFQKADESVGVVYCGCHYVKAGKKRKGQVQCADGWIYERELFRDSVLNTSTWLVKRECFAKAGPFDESLPARQDYDLTIRLSKCYKYLYLDAPLVIVYEEQESRITENVDERIRGSLMVLDKVMEEISHRGPFFRRRVMSSHFYQISRYCHEQGEYTMAKRFALESSVYNPFSAKVWLLILALHLPSDSGELLLAGMSMLSHRLRSNQLWMKGECD